MAGGEVGPRVRPADRSEGAVVAVPAGPVAHLHEMLAARMQILQREVRHTHTKTKQNQKKLGFSNRIVLLR